jgi:sugar phosphate isomerase/epimerase
MTTSRRDFIRFSTLAGAGLLLGRYNSFSIMSEAGKFLERIGISTSLSNNAILAAAGYSFVEENVKGFLMPLEPEESFTKKLDALKESKLPVEACNSFIPGNLKCTGPSPMHEEILKFADTAFRRAHEAGLKTIVFGSGGARAIPEGFSRDEARAQFISLCRQLAPIAGKYDIVISLEPLNSQECNFINSVAEGGEIVKEVKHDSFLLLADIYHMLKENEPASNITKYGHLLYHTHIAEKTGRTAPGVNNEDFTAYFRALKEIKYKGRMAIECNWKNLNEEAAPALKVMRSQISAV